MEKLPVPQAREGSWEELLHLAVGDDGLVLLSPARSSKNLMETRGHRVIGVVYNPEHERFGNYVPTVLPGRYDAFLYIDETRALHPLHVKAEEAGPPDTYPWGV